MNSFLRRSPLLLTLIAVLFPSLVHAHVGIGHTSGLLHGFTHPVSGLDHICAMVAVGLWAAQRGGCVVWLVPLTFVGVMAVGGFLGIAGVSAPFVEEGMVVSVLVLGVLIAAAARLPLVSSVIIVGLFAIFHGHAHGAEMPQTVSGFAYGAGFMLATALLHAVGIFIAVAIRRMGQLHLARFAGGAIALCGVCLCFA
jgi:urease accessory protein